MEKKNGLELTDLNTAAYLSLQNIPITLVTRRGRVFFIAPAEDRTYRELATLQSNPSVGALDLISHLKRLRGKMLDARSAPDGQGDEGGIVNGNRRDS
jgi:uncharacterized NAD(P)/FAD-binding protein YdhS